MSTISVAIYPPLQASSNADPKHRVGKSASPTFRVGGGDVQRRAVSASPSARPPKQSDSAGPAVRAQSRVVMAVSTPARRRNRKPASHDASARKSGWVDDQSPERKRFKSPSRKLSSRKKAKSTRNVKSGAKTTEVGPRPVSPLIGALPPPPIFDPQKVKTIVAGFPV